jgi:dihydrofolate reductase
MMRKVILFNFVTLDGCFEDANGAIDWHVVDEEFHAFALQQLEPVDTILFGRVTYQMMASYWPTAKAVKGDPLIAGKMNETDKVVFSRTLERVDWSNTRLIHENAAEVVARLKQGPGKEMIILGSAKLAGTFTEHGLIDEYRVMVNPIVLGSGHPLFQRIGGRLPMKLVNTRTFRSGNVLLAYQPKQKSGD